MRDILSYESDIWAIADDLLSVSIKQSDFPTYMMPFFALMMLEGRMRNAVRNVEEEEGLNAETDPKDFKEAFIEKRCGYNEYIVMKGKTLRRICMNDTTFEQDFGHYLKAFDPDLKRLLGIDRAGEEKFLNMDTIVANLRAKKILLEIAKKWSEIDLSQYSNSDITTLEEHIKRRWADISASTAGEQYTPDDIISLISEIVSDKVNNERKYVHLYDPTCGGANLLFGVADRLTRDKGLFVATYGSEYNDALYALAAIESRFREDSTIEYGNTLTRVPFSGTPFNIIVANPPYGTKWSGYEKDIKNQEIKQFEGGLPSVADGQLLFMQHILWQLADDGIAVEVHNGSTLFSGDAGSGESNIRKYIFDRDWVEAIIQMPQNEFFNTGIYTYLWVMNKRKPEERRNKVALIDGSNGWSLLKKSKGDKRREMLPADRLAIVEALHNFVNNDICKIFDREHFYYNKQFLTITEISDDGRYFTTKDGKPLKIEEPISLWIGGDFYPEINELEPEEVRAMAKRVTTERLDLAIEVTTESKDKYSFVPELRTIIHTTADGQQFDIGCGAFVFKSTISKKKGVVNSISIETYKYSDYEIIPHRFNAEQNENEIDSFLKKYVFKPYEKGRNIVGVEINFNKEFYVPASIEPVDDILAEIEELENQMAGIEL